MQHNNEQAEKKQSMLEQLLQYKIENKPVFILKKKLKGGITGEVAIINYQGNNEAIKKLCDSEGNVVVKLQSIIAGSSEINQKMSKEEVVKLQSIIAGSSEINQKKSKEEREAALKIKHAKDSFNHEWKLVRNLQNLNNNDSLKLKLRPQIAADNYTVGGGDDDIKVIFNQNIPGMNLEEWMKTEGENFISSVGKDISEQIKSLSLLLANMYLSQREFHVDGYLHLDSTPRNFMYPGILIDFGASLKMDENGIACDDPRFKVIPENNYDHAAKNAKKGTKTILTDLYNLKTGMLECMGYYLGLKQADIEEALYSKILYPHKSSPTDEQDDSELENEDSPDQDNTAGGNDPYSVQSDSEDEEPEPKPEPEPKDTNYMWDISRLDQAYNWLYEYANKANESEDPRAKIVIAILNAYKIYLTDMPKEGQSLQDIMSQDSDLFRKTDSKMVIERYEHFESLKNALTSGETEHAFGDPKIDITKNLIEKLNVYLSEKNQSNGHRKIASDLLEKLNNGESQSQIQSAAEYYISQLAKSTDSRNSMFRKTGGELNQILEGYIEQTKDMKAGPEDNVANSNNKMGSNP